MQIVTNEGMPQLPLLAWSTDHGGGMTPGKGGQKAPAPKAPAPKKAPPKKKA